MLKVNFFQNIAKHNDIKCNLKNVKKLLKNNCIAISNSDLVVFPEYVFSGSMNLECFDYYKKQLNEINLQEELENLSKEYSNATFIFGSAILPREQAYKNISLVVKNGQILAEYSKKGLIYSEKHICKSDDSYPVFKVGNHNIGIAICWDLILPEVFRKYTNRVDLVVVPSLWGIGANLLQAQYSFSLEKKYYSQLCIARSYENAFSILFVNAVGQYNSSFYNDRMMGGSLAIMPPLGEIYKTNNKNSDLIHTVEFDFDQLHKYREFYETDKDYEYYKSKNIF